ncbi:MAG TPA: dTDP-4-dehydrorhamnose 3,5-epimerase [Prosthecobacter sp.]|jgi:dTDP-4-dehydrorhamnose 3,5-epimerase|nr:dTDP-4-dehydrorhamnose 3,5-epimerase [Prosthecobacter sp.]
MKFHPATLEGVLIVEPEPRRDERGFLARTYCEREFAAQGLNTRWVQQNHTSTRQKGSVRGMHWQAEPLPEIKLVRCLAGRVLDVIVDVRPNSPTFGKWHAEELSAENMRALYIPAGFAHGFQCLEDTCELFYLMSEFYQPDLARGLRCDEPQVGIAWPLSILNLSPRDASLPLLSEAVVPTPA